MNFDVESPNSVKGWRQNDTESPLKPALKSPGLPKNKQLIRVEGDEKSVASFRVNLVDAMGSTEQTTDSFSEN